ncbi:MAG: T9SS type B sorting domain-containing protein [Gammaproteobacteria bacterium]|nr:MAG: T9SS type B sorting domain-containing protein [Gammaproteobacteria bacterium]
MLPKLLTALLFCCALHATSQLPVLNWVKALKPNGGFFGTSGSSGGTAIGVDAQGNVYTAGGFKESVDFDPGPGVSTLTAVGISNNIFISKLDVNGNFKWAKQIPTYVEFGRINMRVDAAGNVYVVSDLNMPADMDPGPGVLMMAPTGFRDAFLVKLDTDGNLEWAKQFGGPGDTGPQGDMVELDQNGNVIIAGIFNNTVDFDPGPGVFKLTSSAHMQAFLVKLTNDGNLVWAKQFGNGPAVYSGSHISDMKVDRQGNIVCTGTFARTVDFDPGPNVYTVTSSPGATEDGFICKLDADCNFKWVKTLGQNGTNNHFLVPTGLDIDGMNNIVTTGFFIGNYDFDPGPGTQIVYSNPYDSYLLKLDQQGTLVWAKTIGGTESDLGYDVGIDSDNNVYMIGGFGSSLDFDPGPGVSVINNPNGGAPALVKLSSNGSFIYAAPLQSLNSGLCTFSRMKVDQAGNIFITGNAGGESDFDPGPGVYPFTNIAITAFVLKLSRCLNVTRSTQNISACNSYTLNSQTYSAAGTYYQTIPNVGGCDSIITLNLVLNNKVTKQTKTICEGESFYAAGQNQTVSGIYYDTMATTLGCDSIIQTQLIVNPKPLPDLGVDKSLCKNTQVTLSPGAFASYVWQDNSTDATFTATAEGLYWVQVTNSYNCINRDSFRVVSVLDLPANFLKTNDSICSYKSLELAPLNQFKNYLWSTGALTKSIEVHSPGSYWLNATDEYGCTGSDTITIWPKQCMLGVYVPTAFSPNNDGKNDRFKPAVFGNLLRYRFTIFNRWGTVVFQATDPQKGWDGKINGIAQNAAVFVWTCEYQLQGMEHRTEKGTVLLLR